MTEKEKMLAHQWYDANFDDELKEDRLQAKELCFEYNHTRPSNVKKRNAIMEKLFGYKLENVGISIPFDTDYGWNIKFGKNVFINADIIIGTNNVPPGIFLIIFILKSPVYFSFKYFNATAPIAFAAMIIESSLIVNFGW